MSIFERLGDLPGGRSRRALTLSETSQFFSENYVNSERENARRKLHREAHDLYTGGGREQMTEILRDVFRDPEIRKLREKFADMAQFNNGPRRIVNELSTVYNEPADRRVDNGLDNYRELQRLTHMDERMRVANRWLNLHREVLIGFRVREEQTRRVPVIDLVHPGAFSAIAHPVDCTRLLGVIIDQRPNGFRARPTDPHYLVWTDTESFFLDESGTIIGDTIEPNPFDRMPWVLAHAEQPTVGLLEANPSRELIAAGRALWLQNILLLKESKSANRQVIFQGDTANIVRGQPAETEYDLDVGEGVTAQTVDRAMDLSMYRETADFVLERVAANYGIPPAILQHHGATSGFEIKLRRLPILELREQQKVVFREIERELAQVMSMVLARDMTELAFGTDGWRIDFGEISTPQTEQELLANFEKKRQLSLTSTVEFLRQLNPDLDEPGAMIAMREYIEDEITRNALVEPLKAMNAGPNSPPERNTPAENGARGRLVAIDGNDSDER